jgi:hypothetical protein
MAYRRKGPSGGPVDTSEAGRRGGAARVRSMPAEARREASARGGRARWARIRQGTCPLCGEALGAAALRRTSSRQFVHATCVVTEP